jgi:hypothetical protein
MNRHREQRNGKAAGTVARGLLALACLLVGVPGCVPVSVYPLTDAGAGEKDPGLMGDWFHREGREVLFLHVGFVKEAGLLRLVMIEYDRQGVLKDSEWTGHISRLDGNRYLNLNPVRPEPETPGYLFVKYRIDGDRLCVSLASEKAFEEAIAAGRLRGVVKKDGASSSVLITEEPAGLQRFVLENDRKLFPEESCLSRLSLPETPDPRSPRN